MSETTAHTPPAGQRVLKTYALRDLAVAPENLRFAEPPDDDIPQLAETILAAGVLQPLSVRPGRGKAEKPGMVLDGRRRLLALWRLRDAGRIGDDHPVEGFEETEPGRQAAAAVLTNTAVPVHVADVIAAIGKMLKAKLAPATIAAALGYAGVEVRRLAALSALHPKALEALKAGKLTLRQAKLLARLPECKAQGEIAEVVLNGFGFQEWRVTERLDAGQVTAADRRFVLVGPERYAAAGGRTETDLFGERPDVLLDAEILQAAWTVRGEAIAQVLAAEGRTVQVDAAPGEPEDEALERFGCAYGFGLDAEALETWRRAQSEAEAAAAALARCDLADASCEADIAAFLRAKLAADAAGEPPRDITFVQVFASGRTGLDLRAYGPAALEPEAPASETSRSEAPDAEAEETAGGDAAGRAIAISGGAAAPVAVAAPPELDGVGHALHEVRTDVATRALIRALADDPSAALATLVARLFAVLVLRHGLGKGGGALTVTAQAYGRPRTTPIAALDGEIRQRLADRRRAWEASGATPIAWVAGLPQGETMALLAELVALSLDLREERTTSLRRAARAEAAEIAALCYANVARYWTPDALFLAAHPKGKLVAMLEEMGAADPRAGVGKKDELVALVAERAAERGWAPPCLFWAAEPPAEIETGDTASEDTPAAAPIAA